MAIRKARNVVWVPSTNTKYISRTDGEQSERQSDSLRTLQLHKRGSDKRHPEMRPSPD